MFLKCWFRYHWIVAVKALKCCIISLFCCLRFMADSNAGHKRALFAHIMLPTRYRLWPETFVIHTLANNFLRICLLYQPFLQTYILTWETISPLLTVKPYNCRFVRSWTRRRQLCTCAVWVVVTSWIRSGLAAAVVHSSCQMRVEDWAESCCCCCCWRWLSWV